jgi:hypothetical protein
MDDGPDLDLVVAHGINRDGRPVPTFRPPVREHEACAAAEDIARFSRHKDGIADREVVGAFEDWPSKHKADHASHALNRLFDAEGEARTFSIMLLPSWGFMPR